MSEPPLPPTHTPEVSTTSYAYIPNKTHFYPQPRPYLELSFQAQNKRGQGNQAPDRSVMASYRAKARARARARVWARVTVKDRLSP